MRSVPEFPSVPNGSGNRRSHDRFPSSRPLRGGTDLGTVPELVKMKIGAGTDRRLHGPA
jgi:hypothetical protein